MIAVDLRGHGNSPDDGARSDDLFHQAATDLTDTLRGLRPDVGSVDLLVAHSLGTIVALTCLAENETFANRLVLEEPPGASMPFEAMRDQIPATIRAANADPEALDQQLRAHGFGGIELAERISGLAAADPNYLPILIAALSQLDTTQLAARCRIPTLILLGRDLGLPLSAPNGRQLAEYSHLSGTDRTDFLAGLGNATVVEIEGGHNLHQSLFDEYSSAFASWLAAAEGPIAPQPAGPKGGR